MTVHVIYKQIEKRLSVLEERRRLAQSRFDRIKWGLSYETDDEWFADHKAQKRLNDAERKIWVIDNEMRILREWVSVYNATY